LPQRSQSVHNLCVQPSSMDAEWICAKINKDCLYQHDRLSQQISKFGVLFSQFSYLVQNLVIVRPVRS